MVTDVLTLGGIDLGRQKFGLIYSMAEHPDFLADGGFDFGEKKYGTRESNPFLEGIKEHLDKPEFTIAFKQQNPKSVPSSLGSVTFGASDTTNCESSVNYVPIVWKYRMWEFNIDSYTIGKVTSSRKQLVWPLYESKATSIPLAAWRQIIFSVRPRFDKVQKKYFVKCDKVDDFPTINLKINGLNYELTGNDYTYKVCPNF